MVKTSSNVKIVGRSVKVVDHDGLTIEEVVGNVATGNDGLSLALVTVAQSTSEPWLTLLYDEFIHVTDGYIELHQDDGGVGGSNIVTKVNAGQTVYIPNGSRIRPVFPVPAKYIPACLPAFSPERCIREEGAKVSEVSAKLKELHSGSASKPISTGAPLAEQEVNAKFDHVQIVYHMCQKINYDKAVSSSSAYYPPTFHQDGKFTHATAVPANLIRTANHFYTSTKGEWICIELDRVVLEKLGIITIFEYARPVGDVETDKDWKDSVFPHIFGGIPVHLKGVVTNIYEMKRSPGGTFLSIEGLVN